MAFTEEQRKQLSSKLSPDNVKSRTQAGRQLSYIEGWHAIAEANRIFGFDAWDRQLTAIRQLGEPREIDGKWRVGYMATVRIVVSAGEREIVRDGTGYGSGIDRDVGSAHESAIKEAETDAMKRALMTFGNPFGLALYDKTQENVGHDEPPRTNITTAVGNPFDDASQPDVAAAMIKTIWAKPDRPSLEAWYTTNKETIEALDGADRTGINDALAKAGARFPKQRRAA